MRTLSAASPAGARGTAPILVVDDDPKIVALVRAYLERGGYGVATAADGRAALAAIRELRPGVVILDVMLPEVDGFTVLRLARAETDAPILMLSARGAVGDRVAGLTWGADDYLPKPFSPAELMARVEAILRRAGPAVAPAPEGGGQEQLELDDLTIDLERIEVRRADRSIPLTATEFRLLAALTIADGRVLSRARLLDALVGADAVDIQERSIDVQIGRLRRKLGDVAAQPRYVATVRGRGYRATTRSSRPG